MKFNLKFSIDLNMHPPHPHEYSVDMIQFLLNNPDLMDSLQWQLDSSRSAISIDQLIHLPSPLSYRPVSENSTQLGTWIGPKNFESNLNTYPWCASFKLWNLQVPTFNVEFFQTLEIWFEKMVVKGYKESLWKIYSLVTYTS